MIDGGPGIRRALVNAHEGRLRSGQVVDGHTINYDCPIATEHDRVDLIADLVTNEVVHWKDIDTRARTAVSVADRREGLPQGLTPDELDQLEEHWDVPDQVASEAEPAPDKILVVFMPNELPWAELKIEGRTNHTRLKLTLSGDKQKRRLAAGRYEISVRDRAGGPWQNAGRLAVEVNRSRYVVKLMQGPQVKLSITGR